MVHKEQYQQLADAAAMKLGGYASHIGKIGEDTFVYAVMTGNSADFDSDNPTVVTVNGGNVEVRAGDDARGIVASTNLREFSTGRAIFKKYQTLVKNKSAVVGEDPGYAEAIVTALATKAVKPSLLYQYLEIAEHHRKHLRIAGSDIELV